MERKRNILVVFMLININVLWASNKNEIYNSFVSGDMHAWKIVVDQMEVEADKSIDFTVELINYYYGYIAWCIGSDKNKLAEKYLKLATKHIEVVEKEEKVLSMVFAYKAAFIGYEIGLKPFKAPFVGLQSIRNVNRAIKLDSTNAFAYVQYANIEYYMPAVFGGSKIKALEYYLEALQLMESNNVSIKSNWNYLNLLAIIIEAKLKMKDFLGAKQYCLKALEIEPNFIWVKNELFPKTLKYLEE